MTAPRLFALLVGINKYESDSIPNLRGCVADAMSVQQYLIDSLNVPPDHILMLADASATRQTILQAFQDHFVNNDNITEGDAMLFYFAGHGSQFNAPSGWTTDDGKVETITPHDESIETKVYGIPDRTLFALLHKTAEVRGNNITIILDCCHSGSGTRGRTERGVRGHENFIAIPAELDREILGMVTNRHVHRPSSWTDGTSSHVLLSACRQNEKAREGTIDNGSTAGIFTHQLIKAMRRNSSRQMTYTGLLGLLPSLPDQHPQCEGDNKHCLLFTTVPHHDGQFFKVKKSNATVTVEAGRIHGVSKGTEFTLYEAANSSSRSFGIFTATSARSTSSKLASKNHTASIPDVSYALVSRWGSPDATLAVFVDASSTTILKAVSSIWKQATSVNIIKASSTSDADIILHDVNGGSDIVRVDSLIGGQLGTFLEKKVDVARDRIVPILESAAHFKFHLVRTNDKHPLHGRVTIELYQLEETDDGLLPTGSNLVDDGRARIIFSDSHYGVTLRNNSGYDLFPSLFYFNPSKFSIQPWYLPPSSTMAAPLRQKSVLTIGHGNNDGLAIKFDLKPDDRSDTGFLVLFLSRQYADMAPIQQSGVLDGLSARDGMVVQVDTPIWDRAHATITVARTTEDFESRPRVVPTMATGSGSLFSTYYWRWRDWRYGGH